MPNEFYIDPLAGRDPNAMTNFSRSLSGLGQVLGQRREEKAAQAANMQKKQEIQDVMNSANPQKINALMVKYPDMSDAINKSYGNTNEQTKQLSQELAAQLYYTDDPEQAADLIDQYLPEMSNLGGEPLHLANAAMGLRSGEQSLEQVKSIAMMLNPDLLNEQGGALQESRVGKVSFKDATFESIAEYEKSGDANDLVRYRPEVKDIAGVPHQVNMETGQWESIVDLNDPRISEQTKRLAELEADKQSRLDFGKDKTKFMNGETKLITKLASSRANQDLMQATVNEIKSLMSGWNTKYGASMSLIPGSEARKLKGLINTIKANSAFSTLIDLKESGGTLGAISGAELTLLEAKLGAIDQGGDIEEQSRVLDQILGANQSSINRIDNAYNMDKTRYSGTYDEAIAFSERQGGSGSTPDDAGRVEGESAMQAGERLEASGMGDAEIQAQLKQWGYM